MGADQCNPYSRDALMRHWKNQDDDPYRAKDESYEDDIEMTQIPSYRNVKLTWVHDTKCAVCNCPVTDQFMDCACCEAKWARCTTCNHKYRTDPHRKSNTTCGCSQPSR